MEVGLDGVLISRPTTSVLMPQRQLAAAWERGTGGVASEKDHDILIGAPHSDDDDRPPKLAVPRRHAAAPC
jgi:hypothetical protein